MSAVLDEDLKRVAGYLSELGLDGSTVAVTGATGLIGSLLIRAMLVFNREYGGSIRVIGFARNPEKTAAMFEENEALTFRYGRLFEQEEAFHADYILHTACPTNSAYLNAHPVEVIDEIVNGLRDVLEYGKANGVKKIVYLSSMEAFGAVSTEERVREEELGYVDLRNPRSCYPESKRVAELLCTAYAKEYGVPCVAARLAQTFGAGVSKQENRVFAQFARSAVRGEDIVLHTDGSSVGNYCYTADALRAIFLLLVKGADGETYSVCNEASTMTIAQMARFVADAFSEGKSNVVFDIPEGNKYGYAAATKLHISAEKLRALGWKAEIDQKEAFSRLIRYLGE